VRAPYCALRHLSHAMEPVNATPTADCLAVLLDKLPPLLLLRDQGKLVQHPAPPGHQLHPTVSDTNS
jgi:hypothetical protein